ncbi:hypothetical protein EGR_05780 [Echinococcus granulosus]|uniref:C3H1-type domain-containing protein n=1 Tax=Echinococcus granulosus TaxID=6210 RepID=W6UEF8_ECHGR|nr:hypothetical protein EGR_05780 [Echinococcus granulosus]EUB59296.1 hypothetical protein EGR_05780 [Echinococcus granulosus]
MPLPPSEYRFLGPPTLSPVTITRAFASDNYRSLESSTLLQGRSITHTAPARSFALPNLVTESGSPGWCLRVSVSVPRGELSSHQPKRLCNKTLEGVDRQSDLFDAPGVLGQGWGEGEMGGAGRAAVPLAFNTHPRTHPHMHARVHAFTFTRRSLKVQVADALLCMLSRDSSSSQFLHLVAVVLLLFFRSTAQRTPAQPQSDLRCSACQTPSVALIGSTGLAHTPHYQGVLGPRTCACIKMRYCPPAPQLACWPAALDGGSINASPQAGAALYSPYLATPAAAAAARVGTPAMPSMGSPTEVHQVLAAFAAATAAATASPGAMKDSRWLTLEVCRQYQRKMCSRDENECKFAHPPPHVDVQNGRVICCYDSIKGKCQRRDPPCKYFHPPQHLRELLLQNGRNNLILKNMQLQLLQQQLAQGAMLPGLSAALAATAPTPSVASPGTPATHGIAGAPQCPNPTSPVSSASIGPTGKLIYPPAPSLNLTPQGMATTYSLLLPQPTPPPPPSQPPSATVPTPAIAAAAAALAAANLDASSAQQLAHIFPSPKTVLVGPLCANLYTQEQMTSPTASRKRPAACVNETASAVYAPLFSAPSLLAYGPQLDSTAYQLGAQSLSAVNSLVGSSAQFFHSPSLSPFFFASLHSLAHFGLSCLCFSVDVLFVIAMHTAPQLVHAACIPLPARAFSCLATRLSNLIPHPLSQGKSWALLQSWNGVGLSPYLTPTQLNSMAAAAATAAALKSVPPTVSLANGGGAGAGGLSAAHLAVMAAAATAAAAANASAVAPLAAPATPAKRPALADAKSGLPMFDYGQGLYALQTQAQAQLVGAKNLQPPQPPSQSSQQSPQKSSASTSVVTAAVNVGGVVAQENGVGGQEHGAPNEVDTQKAQVAAVGQFYPETCESIPCSWFGLGFCLGVE